MKKAFLCLIFLIGTTLAGGCRSVETYDDGFGASKRGIEIPSGKLYRSMFFLMEENGSITVQQIFENKGSSLEIIPENSILKVALEGGTLLELHTTGNSDPVRQIRTNSVWTDWTLTCNITTEELQQLSESAITGLKVSFGTTDLIYKFRPKDGDEVQDVANCLLED